MAVAASVSINYAVSGLTVGNRSTPSPIIITSATPNDTTCGNAPSLVLANGDNTIAVPSASCTAVLIQFAAASTSFKKIKNQAGDSGNPVTKNGTLFWQFDAAGAPASFIINSSAADTGNTTEIMFI